MAVGVFLMGVHEGVKSGCIDPMIAVLVELNGFACDQQKWGRCVVIADRLPEICQRLAQVVPGGLLRLVRPQESRQRFPAVGAARLDAQVSQQRPHFPGFKTGDRLISQGYRHLTHEKERQARHNGDCANPSIRVWFYL